MPTSINLSRVPEMGAVGAGESLAELSHLLLSWSNCEVYACHRKSVVCDWEQIVRVLEGRGVQSL